MSKELIVSASSQETKAAILEGGEVVEIHIERERDKGIVGSICKGRVTKVLPGMQSAFVNIGLERDAFLYVSDFFEDTDEYDRIVSTAEERVAKLDQGGGSQPPEEPEGSGENLAATRIPDRRLRPRRARRGRLRGKRSEATSSATSSESGATASVGRAPSVDRAPSPAPVSSEPVRLSLLPGESLAKYAAVSDGLSGVESASAHQDAGQAEPTAVTETEAPSLKGGRTRRRPKPAPADGGGGDASAAAIDEEQTAATETVVQTNGEADSLAVDAPTPEAPASSGDSESVSEASSEAPAETETIPGESEVAAEENPPSPLQAESEGEEESQQAEAPVALTEPSPQAPDVDQDAGSGGSPATEATEPAAEAAADDSAASPSETDDGEPEEAAAELGAQAPQTPAAADSAESSVPDATEPAADPGAHHSDPIQPEDQASKEQAAPESEPETAGVPEAPSGPAAPRSRAPNAQYRSRPNTPRFFRRSTDRRQTQPHGEERQRREAASPMPLIADLLKEGQEILIQIAKEPLGTKGARITSHIALPGRYLVYMPTVNHIGVSRKISSSEERQRVRKIIQDNRGDLPGGFIVRTAGEYKGEDEFKSDIGFLRALWTEIKSQSEKKSAPAIIHRELSLVQRILRDQFTKEFTTIRVDNELSYASMVELIHGFQPSLVNRVKLYTRETPIFEEFGVQAELDKALRSKVWLKSGGYIVIDQAEALVAIDVNTGKYVGRSNKLEDTIAKTNIEAAKEIARQLRLRDLGGIIVCDFIDMEDRKNRLKVTQTLEEALRREKSPSKVLQFNDFGLVAITRKRVKQSLLKVLCEPCSQCSGSGMVKSPQTVCYEIQGEARKMAGAIEDPEMTFRVHPVVAKALKTTEASVIAELESSLKKDVVIKSDPLFPQDRFDIF
jgi:Rne/Rng family ribonuclease